MIALGLLECCGDETKTAAKETGVVVNYEKRSRHIFLADNLLHSICKLSVLSLNVLVPRSLANEDQYKDALQSSVFFNLYP